MNSNHVRTLRIVLSAWAALQLAAPAHAEEPPVAAEELSIAELEELALEDLLNLTVVTSTKKEERTGESPAVVMVLSREELRRAGHQSVAEALAQVPGLVVSTDHVFHNVGVRGITGGIRGGNRHIKFMINGQPMAYRSDAQHLLGPEFIPMSAIERIEIIRGPASSLYGVNAFLGVVNIITRTGDSVGHRGEAQLGGGVRGDRPWGVAEALGGHHGEKLDVFVAASTSRLDRSGLTLPLNSPDRGDYGDNLTGQNDLSTPVSAFGTVAYDAGNFGRMRLQLNLQKLDAGGEYVDTGAMSHLTHVSLMSWSARLEHSVDLEVLPVSLASYLSVDSGAPQGDDVVLPVLRGNPTSQLVKREFGYRAISAGVEAQTTISKSSIMAGVEADVDREELRRNVLVSREGGLTLNAAAPVSRDFTNLGVYVQGLLRESDALGLSANIRYDITNQFGSNLNYRVAAVWNLSEALHLKLLSGSSFQAPSPEQLYGPAEYPGGVQGALASSKPVPLEPQKALTHEIEFGYGAERTQVSVSGFMTTVDKRIEYQRIAGNLQPVNLSNSRTLGVDLLMRQQWATLFNLLNVDVRGGVSYQNTRFVLEQAVTPRESELLSLNDLYPAWSGQWGLHVSVPRWFFEVDLRMVIYGARLQSQTNQSSGRSFEGDPLHWIEPSYPLDLAVTSSRLRLLGNYGTTFQLAMFDVLNTGSPEPGFNGINAPSLGRRMLLKVSQEF